MRGTCEELRGLHGQLDEARAQNARLTERIRSIEALLEASQARDTQVSSPLPGPLHPTHPWAPRPMTGVRGGSPGDDGALLSFQASRVEADQQQAR